MRACSLLTGKYLGERACAAMEIAVAARGGRAVIDEGTSALIADPYTRRRQSSAGLLPPAENQNIVANPAGGSIEEPCTSSG